MPSDTPLTDAQILSLDCDDSCCAIYVKRGDTAIEGDIVPAEFARKLEREVARLNAYIQDITWHPNWEPTKV